MTWRVVLQVAVVALVWSRAQAVLAAELYLDVTAGADLPEAATLQAAIEQELGVTLRASAKPPAGSALLVIRPAPPGRANVDFTGPEGRRANRTVVLPTEPAQAADTLALLAANLVRNEAAELLATLRPVRAPPVAVVAEVQAPPPTFAPVAEADQVPYREVPLAIELVPGLGWPYDAQGPARRHLSLGLIGTHSAALDGFEAASVFNLQTDRVSGVQLAGAVNVVTGPVAGAQVAAAVNVAWGGLRGAQLGGGVNLARSLAFGVQGGPVNLLVQASAGVQGGVVNVAGGDLRGVQAGVVNVAGGDLRGVQAGVVNVAGGDLRGVQAGVVNLAAGRVHGVQLGVVNVAEDADAGIGVLSLYWRGRTHLQVSAQESGLLAIDVKHGSRLVHQILALATRQEHGRRQLVPGYGIGVRIPLGDRLHLDIDALEYLRLAQDNWTDAAQLQSQLRAEAGVRLWGPLGAFAGVSFNVMTLSADQVAPGSMDKTMMAQNFGLKIGRGDTQLQAWPGVVVGLSGF